MKYKKIIKPILGLLILTSIISIFLLNIFKEEKISLFIESEPFKITKYYIYGTSFNLEGTITLNEKITELNLILFNQKELKRIPLLFTYKNDTEIDFYISKFLNKGIDLDLISINNYELLIEIPGEEQNKYYRLKNDTEYGDLEYYTLTKNESNNKITIAWNNGLQIIVKKEELPDNIYDIVLDPGHSGSDPGAIGTLNNTEYYERNINLSICESLQKILESMGYKVAITRTNNTEKVKIYESGGSAVLANEVKAKYNFAIHNNSSINKNEFNGLELYIINDIEFSLARSFVENIKTFGKTNYSNKLTYNIEDGIYRRNFTINEIEIGKSYAKENKFDYYNVTTYTSYYYYLRELGGILTNAYIDGRDPNYPTNPYYNSNHVTESYLFELSYMNSTTDLSNMLSNIDGYAQGIAEGLKNYINEKDN